MAGRFRLPLPATLLATGCQHAEVGTDEPPIPYVVDALRHALQQKVVYRVLLAALHIRLLPFVVHVGQHPPP